MAKALAYLEQEMQARLGEEEGRLFYYYELPEEQKMSVEEHQAQRLASMYEEAPWIEVELINGSIPEDAIETIELLVPERLTVTRSRINWDTRQVEEYEVESSTGELVSSGEFVDQLKSNYRFTDGKLYRKPTIAEFVADTRNLESAELPNWLTRRVDRYNRQQATGFRKD